MVGIPGVAGVALRALSKELDKCEYGTGEGIARWGGEGQAQEGSPSGWREQS